MYLLDKFGGHIFNGNGDISSYINSYMNNSEKAELTVSICHIEISSKSGIPIDSSEVLDKANRKTRKRRTQIIAKCYTFHANKKNFTGK